MKLILGTMTFGQQVEEAEAKQILQKYIDSGYGEIDTAFVYNEGNSEKILGKILNGISDYTVATKVNPRITGKLDYAAVMQQFETSLARMNRENIDILYLHFPDEDKNIESALMACDELYRKGKIKEIGFSNFSKESVEMLTEKCTKNSWKCPTVYQGLYNPLSRNVEELFEVLRKYEYRFYAYNPLAGGILSGKYNRYEESPENGRFVCRPNYKNRYWKESFFDAMDLIKKSCEEYNIEMYSAAYRWLAYHSRLSSSDGDGIIIGASNIKQLELNIEAIGQGRLPEEIAGAFDRAWEICKKDAPQYYRNVNFKG
ncbi:MAG: aldo/keto reductase [Lachnospiraceae bacterium]|nr:aldo/keto reductase [Lachnospiraceae bacterium]